MFTYLKLLFKNTVCFINRMPVPIEIKYRFKTLQRRLFQQKTKRIPPCNQVPAGADLEDEEGGWGTNQHQKGNIKINVL